MKKTLKATSIIEAIIVLIVVVTGIVGVYNIMITSQRLSNSTANRIQAIQIARDGLEAFTNIRDTNWQLFAADYENCWNSYNYDSSCIGNTTTATNRIRGFAFPSSTNPSGYAISKNSNNQFELAAHTMLAGQYAYTNPAFRNNFRVGKDVDGFYTQSGGTDTRPLYTRYIKVEYQNTDGGSLDVRTEDAMDVEVIVEWYDPASKTARKVEMNTVLTNWKAKK